MALKVDRVQLEIDIKHDSSRKRLRELEDDIRSVKSELTKASKANDSKTYQELTKRHRTLISEYDTIIERIGVNNMSLRELRNRHKDLSAVLRNLPPTHESYKPTREELDKINSRMKELRGTAKETGSSLSKFGMSFQVMLGNLMTKGIQKLSEWVSKAKEFIVEGMNVADKAEGIVTAFNKLNAPDLLRNMRTETKGLISDFQIMQTAVRADKFGIPLNKLGSLLKFAQQRAQETGDSIDYLVDSIINGIGRKSPLILDNLGIAASRLQEQTKITGDFTAAAINIVNEELEKQGNLALTSADKVTQTAVKWENAQLKIGQRFQWLGTIWNTISGNMADAISELAGDTRTATQVFDDQIEKVAELESNIKPLTERYTELQRKSKLSIEEQTELDRIMNTISSSIPGVVAEFDKYGNILYLNTQKVYDYIEAEETRLNYMHKEAIETLKKQRAEIENEIKKQTEISQNGAYVFTPGGMFGGSSSSLDNSDETLENAKKRVQELGKDLEEIDNDLSRLSGKDTEEILIAQKNLLENRQKFTAMNAKELKTWINDEKNANDEYLALAKTIYGQRVGSGNDDPKTDKSAVQRTKLNNEMKKLEETHLKEMADIQRSFLEGKIKTEFDFNQELLLQQDKFDESRKKKLKELAESLTDPSVRIDILKQIADIDKKILDRQVDQANKIKKILLASDPIAAEKEAHDNRLREVGLFGKKRVDLTKEQISALDQLEKQHNDNMQKISSKEALKVLKQLDVSQSDEEKMLAERRVSEKMSEQQYRDELLKIEIDFLNKRLLINGLSAEKIDEINKQINQATSERFLNREDARESILTQFNLKNLKDQKTAELELIKYFEKEKVISQEEALKIRAQIDQRYLDSSIEKFAKANDSIQQVGGDLTGAMTNFQSAEESAITRKYDKQIKAAEGNSKKQKKLEEKKEAELLKLRAEYADKQFVVQAAQIASETAVAAMRAYSAGMSLGPAGFVIGPLMAAAAIAYGFSQLKAANEQRQAAKEGYQVGGYTPTDNRDDKPVGTVHANEFVANANAVRNPSVRKFLDVFDMAQKNGTIHMLNTTQILEKVRAERSGGYQVGGYTPPDPVNQVDPSVLINVIERNTEAMNKMKEKLDDGIEAYSVISGDSGSYRQTQRYESLLRNASRR